MFCLLSIRAVSSVKWGVGFDEYFEAEQGGKLTILAS